MALLAAAQPASAAPNPTNPLRGDWRFSTGAADGVYPAFQQSSGTARYLLAKIALQPRVRWFGSWIPANDVESRIRSYIAETQNGDPHRLVQLAIFNMFPHSEARANEAWSAAMVTQYRQWINAAAAGIGGSRVAMILEPDLGVALNGWNPGLKLRLARYAAQTFGRLPNTTVYLEASAPDWLFVDQAVNMLKAAGVAYVRGFALNATHYDTTANNVRYGRALVAALGSAGIPNKHFVVNTADNGKGFTWQQYWAAHPHGNFNNAEVCATRASVRCVTLGIPPTTRVADPRWGLPPRVATMAANWCDAYLWYGRPWLTNQANPYNQSRALQVARTSPF